MLECGVDGIRIFGHLYAFSLCQWFYVLFIYYFPRRCDLNGIFPYNVQCNWYMATYIIRRNHYAATNMGLRNFILY